MRSTTILFFFLAFAFAPILQINAQEYTIRAVVKEKFRTSDPAYAKIEPGTAVEITGYRAIAGNTGVKANINGNEHLISSSDLDHLEFQNSDLSTDATWYQQFITSSAVDQLSKRGWDQEVRRELQEEYINFNETITMFDDPFLDDYLNQLLLKLFPQQPVEKHPAVMRTRVYESAEPGTFACANGDIFLSTGLLAALQSEEELIAILAQEIAHIQFNHSVDNYRRNLTREARAIFWSGVITVAAAVTETAVANNAVQNGTFSPVDLYTMGAFTESVAILSSTIAFQVANRLGMKYTHEQEIEADRAAQALLAQLKLDNKALLNAYLRIDKAQKSSRSFKLQASEDRLLPHLYSQMVSLGYKKVKYDLPQPDNDFIDATAMARRKTAWQEYMGSNYARTQDLLTLQLEADAAVLEDYMLQSVLLRKTSNLSGDMERALMLLNKAEKEAYALSPEIHLEKAMVLLRLDRKENAKQELESYRNALKSTNQGDDQGARIAWVTQMLEKLSR
ncbi:MAG: M48 family metalloprotease [Phaeodactylibacter sp.]|nr:M48 family metalloprotease [Phaeodactylibacter sp.]